jgi:Uma2 family endonuclease
LKYSYWSKTNYLNNIEQEVIIMTVLTKPFPRTMSYMKSVEQSSDCLLTQSKDLATEKEPSILDGRNGYYKETKEEFPYGWRTIKETGPVGEMIYRDIALTPDDFLDPKEGDTMPQSIIHDWLNREMNAKLEKHFAKQPDVLIFGDVKLLWGVPGLKEPCPDVSVVKGVKDVSKAKGSFDCRKHGVCPCLVMEIMSPNYPGDDDKKVKIYERAGIEEYIIINPHVDDDSLPFELIGYRLVRGRYKRIKPNDEGQLLSQTTGILIGLTGENNREVELIDSVTGERLLGNLAEHEARLVEHKARLQADARAEQEALRAEQEAQARLEAEARAEQERLAKERLAAKLRELGIDPDTI